MLEQFTRRLGGAGKFFAVAMVCFKQKLCLKKQKSNINRLLIAGVEPKNLNYNNNGEIAIYWGS